jgi:hypothetical protein
MTHAGGFDVTVGGHRIFTFFGKHLGAEPGSGG